MKSFDDVTHNKSLASFLNKNYALGNNEGFFNTLKSFESSSFGGSLSTLTGEESLSRFTGEDLSVLREVSSTMNELMFDNKEQPLFETAGTIHSFNFKNDNSSRSQYAFGRKQNRHGFSIGYGMSHTNIFSDDDQNTVVSEHSGSITVSVT